MRCKEAARQTGLATCKKHGLQFLDDTVSLEKISWQRNSKGVAGLTRRYSFEFTSDGSQRYKGKMQVTAGLVSKVELPPYRIAETD